MSCNPVKVNANPPDGYIFIFYFIYFFFFFFTFLFKNNTNILLQLANTLTADKNKTKACAIIFSLDVRSQQTFMTHGVVDELKLKSLREIYMDVSF